MATDWRKRNGGSGTGSRKWHRDWRRRNGGGGTGTNWLKMGEMERNGLEEEEELVEDGRDGKKLKVEE